MSSQASKRTFSHFSYLLFSLLFLMGNVLFFSPRTWAEELSTTYRTPRSIGMGGAHVAVAQGPEALFNNPALLSSKMEKKRVQLPQGSGTVGFDSINVLTTANEASQNPNQVHKLLTPLIGKHGHADWNVFPAYAASNMALGGYFSGAVDTDIHNPVIPEARLSYLTDTGLLVGWGGNLSVASKGISRWGDHLSLGIAANLSHCYGGVREFELDDFIAPSSGQNISIQKSRLYLLDFDLGALYTFHSNNSLPLLDLSEWRPAIGFVIHRLLGSQIGIVIEDPKGNRAADLRKERVFDLGFSLQSPPWKSHSLLLAADFRNLGRSFSPRRSSSYLKHLHLGTELQFFRETLFLRTGLSQGYLAGGLGFRAGKVSIDAALYQEELGEREWSRPDLRGSLALSANWQL